MGVFAHDERTRIVVFQPLVDHVETGIHRADDIGDVGVERLLLPGELFPAATLTQRTLVMNPAGGVKTTDPAGAGSEIRPDAGLVAERPLDDAGVILIAEHHPGDAVHHRRQPLRIIGQMVIEGVTLDVRLVDHVEPVLVAEREQPRIVRVVAGADRIEIELLHEFDVAAHQLDRNGLAPLRIQIVPVDAEELHRLAVDQKISAGELH